MAPGVSAVVGAACLLAVSLAPFQCARSAGPETRMEDDPAEALYKLSERFHEQGEEAARRQTLDFLIERYPASRFASAAKDDLAGAPR